jgi:hypothetical protein
MASPDIFPVSWHYTVINIYGWLGQRLADLFHHKVDEGHQN